MAGSTCIYVSAAVFPGHGLGQSDHPGLRSAVVGLPNVSDDPGKRRDVDDPSLGPNQPVKNCSNL